MLCFRHISYSCGCTAFMHTCHVYCTVYSSMLFYDWIEFGEDGILLLQLGCGELGMDYMKLSVCRSKMNSVS